MCLWGWRILQGAFREMWGNLTWHAHCNMGSKSQAQVGKCMNKILVLIPNISCLFLSASFFAIKFAKRTPTKVHFLIFVSIFREVGLGEKGRRTWPKQFGSLIQQARVKKINPKLFFSHDEYQQVVSQFARGHNTNENIVVGPCPVQDRSCNNLIREVNALKNQGKDQIIVIKSREGNNLGISKEFLGGKAVFP